MNDVKVRILISWIFLLIMWPIGIYISVVLRSPYNTMTIFNYICPAMASLQRSKKGTLKYYMPFLFIIGSLLLEIIKIYNPFPYVGAWRFIIIIFTMALALAWYIRDDFAILTNRKSSV